MPTQEEQALKARIIQDLKESGSSWGFVGEWPAKATYYKPNGEAMENLPADPWSMKRYLQRGLTLAPPTQTTKPQGLVCECGFEAKSPFGLMAHKRRCKKE